MSALTRTVDECLHATKALTERPRGGFYEIEGMSGWRYRDFINRLIGALQDPTYLEIGLWSGSTFCSAIAENYVMAVGIDNWSSVFFSERGMLPAPRDEFHQNLNRFKCPQAGPIQIIESDFRNVGYGQFFNWFDVYFFDGPHDKEGQRDGLQLPLPALKREFVYIVDDWNWPQVREGTKEAIEACGLIPRYSCAIRTTSDDTHPRTDHGAASEWHNGCFISVLEKSA